MPNQSDKRAQETNNLPDPCPSRITERLDAEMPVGIPRKPETKEKFKRPVAWLGGRELLANLKLFVLHALFGGKLDARDWMTGVVNVFKDPSKPAPAPARSQEGEELYTRAVELDWSKKEEPGGAFWFDYLADTGDGQMALYDIAYLCMSELYLADKSSDVHLEEQAGGERLPRGEFLFIGGDTAYHVADYETLAQRFQAPFWWAYRDLLCDEHIPEDEMGKRRPLFGIPANHDYYDALDGFNRQFRRPITGENDKDERAPQLQLPTFERHQEASYVALKLPHDWWLWGIDTENDEIDFRQQTFFKLIGGEGGPKKLIVATPSPTTVFGQQLKPNAPLAQVFECIGLKRPFLKSEGPEVMGKGECRLDLSGDIHHYARYFGPQTEPDDAKRPRYKQHGATVSSDNYASVVSGGGGAFFDPTNTYFGDIKEQAIFPEAATSLKAISKEILDYMNIWHGGSVHYIGAFLAFVICFAAILVPGSHDLLLKGVNPLPGWLILTGLGPVILSLGLVIMSCLLLKTVLKWSNAKARAGGGTHEDVQRRSAFTQTATVSFLLLLVAVSMMIGISVLRAHRPLPAFGDSLVVFFVGAWAIALSILNVLYTEPLNERAKKGEVEWWEFWPPRVMLGLAAVGFCSGLWFFGRGSSPAHHFADVVFITVVVSAFFGLPLLAGLVGADRHPMKGKVGYALLGVWHAVLHLTVPLLWILGLWSLGRAGYKGSFYFILLFIAGAIFRWLGIKSVEGKYRKSLLFLWLGFGLLTILPPVIYLAFWAEAGLAESVAAMSVWARLGICIGAAIIGAFLSCVWFGWYLAVAMVFNGHNNEAGGAARLEGYKQFMRIRLTANDLTAYVIGFDEARPQGKDLAARRNLRLVDQFRLTVK
jgi:hypothetical protein